MTEWIAELFKNHDLTRMGHGQRVDDLNLGLGWLYYGLARVIRPKLAVVIGSYRGFVPLVLGKALAENTEQGEIWFVDPSFVDDFWSDPARVAMHFAAYGVHNIRHFHMTTQQFVHSEANRSLGSLSLLMIDGFHSEEQAQFDFEAFKDRLTDDAIVLFHDTKSIRSSSMYGENRRYELRVKCFVDRLKEQSAWQVLDLPFYDGVSLVRRSSSRES